MFTSLFQQIREFWQNQPLSRRITIIVLLISTIVAVVIFTSWASQPAYSVAFSGLSEEDAGAITQKLVEQGIAYKLRNTTTIMVPTDKVYEVRLAMARDGLPASSSVGYELFNANSLIMTEFTQQVNYQRALEGELERTIGSLDSVKAVRVHVVIPETKLLTQDKVATTASITIQVKPGKELDQSQVRAITHLISSSVEGMRPQDVVIVDTEGNMLASGADGEGNSASQMDTQRAIELSAAQLIKKNVQNLLDTVLGPNRSVVQSSVIMDWTQRETISKTYSPTGNPVLSSQKVNESYSTTGDGSGVPGAGTNLPQPTIVATVTGGVLTYQRSEETTNYEITQSESHETASPGQVKQISLSVLVDGIDDVEQLAIIKSAVIAAAGIDTVVRGDIISVESLAFDRVFYEDQTAEMNKQAQMDTYYRIAEIGVPILIIFILLFFFWTLFRNLRKASTEAWIPVLKPVAQAALAAGVSGFESQPAIGAGVGEGRPRLPETTLSGEEFSLPMVEPIIEEPVPLPPLPAIKKTAITPEEEQLNKVVTRLAEESPSTVAEIIQVWLSEDKG